jgi:hypothetical protein
MERDIIPMCRNNGMSIDKRGTTAGIARIAELLLIDRLSALRRPGPGQIQDPRGAQGEGDPRRRRAAYRGADSAL